MPIGPCRPLNLAKPESIDIRQAARYFGARGEADALPSPFWKSALRPFSPPPRPGPVWLEADVESLTQAGILKGEDIFRHLEGCSEALLLAVTVGPGVDGQIRRAGVGDIAAGVASDAIGSVLAEQAADAAEAELRQWAAEQDKYLTAVSRRATATGPSGCSRWWRRHWTLPAGPGSA